MTLQLAAGGLDEIDSCVQRCRLDGLDRASGSRRESVTDVDQLDASPELGLNSPVALGRPFVDGMGDHTSDGDHRRLAGRRDRRDELLHEGILVGEHLVEVALGGIGFAVADVQRQSSGATDRWLDDRIVPAVESHQLTKIGDVLFGHDDGGHDRNAALAELDHVALVQVPAQQRRRVEDGDIVGVEFPEPRDEPVRVVHVVPRRSDHQRPVSRDPCAPDHRNDLGTGGPDGVRQDSVVGSQVRRRVINGQEHGRRHDRCLPPRRRQCTPEHVHEVRSPTTSMPFCTRHSRRLVVVRFSPIRSVECMIAARPGNERQGRCRLRWSPTTPGRQHGRE